MGPPPGGAGATELQRLLARICERLNALAAEWLAPDTRLVDPRAVRWEVSADPYSGAEVARGQWTADHAGRRGEISINEDGSFFAEYDVLVWQGRVFVEAVSAWGRGERLCGEVRRLQLPE